MTKSLLCSFCSVAFYYMLIFNSILGTFFFLVPGSLDPLIPIPLLIRPVSTVTPTEVLL